MRLRLLLGIAIILANVTSFASGSEDLEDLSFDNEDELNTTDEVKDSSELPQSKPRLPTTDEEKKDFLKRIMTTVMKRPGARSRLGQVLPIVRQMSAPQRLALASLVMSQVLADPNDPLPELPQSSENATAQLMLPISMDIASLFRGLGREQQQSATGRSSHGYAAELYGGRLRPVIPPGIHRHQTLMPNGINRRNANVHIDKLPSRPRPGRPHRRPIGGEIRRQSCGRVSNNVCVETIDYPEEAILATIQNDEHPERFKLFMTEPPMDGELEPELQRRKSDSPDSQKGHMCSSRVELARPKKARATSGQWKFIVNTKDYTQTLRLEICSRPQTRCNYLPEGIDSQCIQVYNYHRLLTWDETAGLTMDVFKVPTCCSCRVLGYNGVPFSVADKTSPAPDLDSNLVSSDDNPSVRVPQIPSTSHKPSRGYVPPKRESPGRWPTIQHRGPPLPLEGESAHEEPRYPPLDNTLRRTTRNNTIDRTRFKPPLNTRHPALPMDNVNVDTMSVPVTPHQTGPRPNPPRRINYSYHPIIDYFRPHGEEKRAEARIGHDWTPITASDVAV